MNKVVRLIIGLWMILVSVMFYGYYLSEDAATFEPYVRLVYMVVLVFSIVFVALSAVRSKQNGEG